jgi:LysR family transcriptional regulator, hca operon transcriptional activator
VVLPSEHPLASQQAIGVAELAGLPFISVSRVAPVLRAVIDDYLTRSGLAIAPAHEVDNLTMAISLIVSTGGVALCPPYIQNLLPASVTTRPLQGEAPTIDLAIGYHRANTSPILKLLLSRVEAMSLARAGRTIN